MLDLYDVVELEEEIVEQIRDGVFPKDKVRLTQKPPLSSHELCYNIYDLGLGGRMDIWGYTG